MKIFLFLSIIILAILFIGKRFFLFARRNLLKDQAAWSGKDMKIKYKGKKDISDPNGIDNYLKIIADESKIFLEEESNKEEN